MKNRSLSDSVYIERIKNSDRSAFRELYYKYYNDLYRFAFFRIRSKDICCDLLQDLFFNIWSRRESLNPGKSIKAYLYKSLNNAIINYKKLFFTKAISLDDINSEPAAIGSHTVEIIDLNEALNKIPDNLSLVFQLSRFDGFKYAEIADICGISVKAVEKRMSAALTTLRKILSDD
jgi:RNA polymerase sigma-70 factor (ECF subfamily)